MSARKQHNTSSDGSRTKSPGRGAKFRRARLRRFLFTHGPHRISGGRITQRHLAKPIELREVEIISPRWPSAFDGLRIGHISDFHVGDLLPAVRAVEIIELLAAQKPDIVACTGDVIDLHAAGSAPAFKALGAISAPFGTLLVLGNHDEIEDRQAVVRLAERAGLRVLQNEMIEIIHNGARLDIAGVNWAKRMIHCTRAVKHACEGAAADLLLSHNPKSFRQASRLGVPLTLAGHTHGGQIAMRNRPNVNLSFTHRHRAGLFEKHGSHLFVTTGVGAWFPLRVNCPAEFAIITMRSAGNGSAK